MTTGVPSLWQGAPCGLLVTDASGAITAANHAFAELVGQSEEQLLAMPLARLLSGGSRIYFETYAAQLLQLQGHAHAVELTLLHADGGRMPVLANVALVPGDRPQSTQVAVFEAASRSAFERELLDARHRAEASDARATVLAKTLQATLIPPTPPEVAGLDIATAYRPAGTGEEVGGDFYDVFEVDAGDWVVIIGDVSGKGAAAAVVSSLARHTLRAACVRDPSPAAALLALHEALIGADTDRFCTAVVMRLRRQVDHWTCAFSVGGHSLPLVSCTGGTVRAVGTPGSLVGALADPVYVDSELTLRAGDLLLLCTDGLTEGRRGREFFGDDRIVSELERHTGSAADTVASLLAAVLSFQSGHPRDDIAIVAVAVSESVGPIV